MFRQVVVVEVAQLDRHKELGVEVVQSWFDRGILVQAAVVA